MRFDYFGCGDSAGDFEQGSLNQWVSDIQSAVKALADLSDQGSISLLGLRMGATLAMMAAEQSDAFDTLVLWEPILDGRQYLTELSEMQKALVRRVKGKEGWGAGLPEEVLGFPLTIELQKDIKAIQADSIDLPSEMRLMAVCNSPDDTCSETLDKLINVHSKAEKQIINDHRVWREELYKRLIPITTLNFLADWIDKAHL